jgi:PAS domain S-box-containing protein
VNHTPLRNAVLLQVFIAVTSLTGLILAAVISERQQLGEALKERTRELEQNTVQLAYQAELLDLANDAIFVRTTDDKISYWNQGAERLYGWTSEEVLGKSPGEVFRTEFTVPLPETLQDRWEGELRRTRKDGSEIVVASRWTTLRDHNGKPVGWLEINTDVTARRRAEGAARSLSGRILTLQDDERRRIARGLHDSLGQYLAALGMKLDQLSTHGREGANLVSECSEIVEQCLSETRTISHLLHPPLLDEAGIGSAVRLYVDGFAQRSSIKVNLDLSPELGRLQADVEIALFRAVQEALTNVHRHSGSSSVDISIDLDAEQVRLEIKDNGRGIPKKHLTRLTEGDAGAGVGIAGMRERIRELRGSLEIESNKTGTKLIVVIPSMPRGSIDSAHDDGRSRSISAG